MPNRNLSQWNRAVVAAEAVAALRLARKLWSKSNPSYLRLLYCSRAHHRPPKSLRAVNVLFINKQKLFFVRANVFANNVPNSNYLKNGNQSYNTFAPALRPWFHAMKFEKKNICKNGKYKLLGRTKRRPGHCNFYNDFYSLYYHYGVKLLFGWNGDGFVASALPTNIHVTANYCGCGVSAAAGCKNGNTMSLLNTNNFMAVHPF